ncbi:MazG-like family protein [Lacticaseibacillus brantae]|uniref:NTP pyrophosphohydrolase MazG-like domain-containing protein n=1 Tax=Lacticaseibacillus brantae DSM 23927 TaxID=1423727 RepID=A0A0R2B1W2_9LACO|nr:MazG-like family protein [Lacticaseibacillus brantae]KRM73029.1 hypothetical protein FC34_GL000750 [Lacticaseibacillus brantae DSM 23927]
MTDPENDWAYQDMSEKIDRITDERNDALNRLDDVHAELIDTRLENDHLKTKLEMSSVINVTPAIKAWAINRKLDTADPSRQLNKLTEEVGELAEGFNKKKPDQIKDSLGDMYVVMTIFAMQLGLDIEDCISVAYEVIKDREGEMVDGAFGKMGD